MYHYQFNIADYRKTRPQKTHNEVGLLLPEGKTRLQRDCEQVSFGCETKRRDNNTMAKSQVKPADYLFWAVKQQTGNQLRNHILIILADHRNTRTGRCDPSHATIARRVGCTSRAVRTHIAWLEKNGLISHERRSKDGMKTSSQYTFPLVGADRKDVPNDRNVVPIGTEGGSYGDRKEVPINHRSLTTELTTELTPIAPFDIFYNSYPKKTGRQDAQKAWNKLDPSEALISRIMIDIVQRVERGAWCTGKGKQYIPGPAPYLNKHRWTDEIIPRPEFKQPQDFSLLASQAQDLTENL